METLRRETSTREEKRIRRVLKARSQLVRSLPPSNPRRKRKQEKLLSLKRKKSKKRRR